MQENKIKSLLNNQCKSTKINLKISKTSKKASLYNNYNLNSVYNNSLPTTRDNTIPNELKDLDLKENEIDVKQLTNSLQNSNFFNDNDSLYINLIKTESSKNFIENDNYSNNIQLFKKYSKENNIITTYCNNNINNNNQNNFNNYNNYNFNLIETALQSEDEYDKISIKENKDNKDNNSINFFNMIKTFNEDCKKLSEKSENEKSSCLNNSDKSTTSENSNEDYFEILNDINNKQESLLNFRFYNNINKNECNNKNNIKISNTNFNVNSVCNKKSKIVSKLKNKISYCKNSNIKQNIAKGRTMKLLNIKRREKKYKDEGDYDNNCINNKK